MHAKLHEIEKLYGRVKKEITASDTQSQYLLRIYNDLVIILSEASELHFNTLFARVSFITSRYPLSRSWAYALQIPRREIQHRTLTDAMLIPILHASIQMLLHICNSEHAGNTVIPDFDKIKLPKLPAHRRAGRYKKRFARVIAVEWDQENKLLTILDEEEPDATCVLHYCIPGINDIFSDTLELALKEMGMPLILGLTDIDCTEANQYIPSYIVIMPDLLLDVTSITQVYTSGSDPQSVNIIDTFLPSQTTIPILIGQVANFFLDELIRDIRLSFQDLFTASFKIYPIEFVRLTDEQVKQIFILMKTHYDNILKVIQERFPSLGIERSQCVIEPSYFSPQYGIKGRLDLYYEHQKEQTASIIELKSNRPFKPNSYGLSSPNYHQTLLYELLIKSSHGPKHHRANYILYSAESKDTLRYAVSVESIQKETIHNRNQLVLLQSRLTKMDREQTRDIFQDIDPEEYEQIKGYVKKNIEEWHNVYSSLAPGEKSYFKSFTAFITREHMLARIGSERGEGSGGLAGLWLDKTSSKEERYQILQCLELLHVEKDKHQTLLTFQKSNRTNPLANFRAGDIGVMYPYEEGEAVDPTKYQLHRSTVLMVDATSIVIRLRNMQVNTREIERIKYWNLEHDLLDSSFRSLYQSLWTLMSTDVIKRQLILGLLTLPVSQSTQKKPVPALLTATQEAIYQKAIDAEFLYLLWGPPGTGKTSMMLKSWVWYYYHHTPSRIVLLAYTNKAVDEICQALSESGQEVRDHYIRIGSRAATGEAYRHRLLDNAIEPMTTRAQIRDLLEQTRIYVSTVASFQGKSELHNLIHFDVAIMDEASQLLEPAIVGLLTKFNKTILIGDHMQLPAVSVQPESMSRIEPGKVWHERIGLTTMSMSYFERLYRLYQRKGWHHMIGILNEQGRMHLDIMAFANRHVYGDLLTPVDAQFQGKAMHQLFPEESAVIFRERLIFIPASSALDETYLKTNREETLITMELIRLWQEKLKQYKLDWTIGVITPFRAQIAAMVHLGHQMNMDLSQVTIDTVERYQGGARDIIIMSCAVNSMQALTRISSVNSDGVDRKLNVAVTRARQQFILIGNQQILQEEAAYAALMDMCKSYQPSLQETILTGGTN